MYTFQQYITLIHITNNYYYSTRYFLFVIYCIETNKSRCKRNNNSNKKNRQQKTKYPRFGLSAAELLRNRSEIVTSHSFEGTISQNILGYINGNKKNSLPLY